MIFEKLSLVMNIVIILQNFFHLVAKERDGGHRHDDTDEYDTEDEIEM